MRHSRPVAAVVLSALMGAVAPAQAAERYTIKLRRTTPAPLWVGIASPTQIPGQHVWLKGAIGPQGTERWWLSPQPSSVGLAYQVMNVYSARCMDIEGPSRANGTAVHQWTCHSGDSQKWRLVRAPPGRQFGHQIINVYAGKCLDVPGFRNQPNTALQIWSCSLAWNQDFVVDRVPGLQTRRH